MDRNIVQERDKVQRVARAILAADTTDLLSRDGYPEAEATTFAEAALAAIADDNIVQELCEALAEARLIVANLPHGERLLLAKIDAALAKAGFNEGGAGNNGKAV